MSGDPLEFGKFTQNLQDERLFDEFESLCRTHDIPTINAFLRAHINARPETKAEFARIARHYGVNLSKMPVANSIGATPNRLDRHLLLGLLALQCGFISKDQIVAAFSDWTSNKTRSLEQILTDNQAITSQQQSLLTALVEEHIKQHDNDPVKSLDALSTIPGIKQDLERLEDSEINATLVRVQLRESLASDAHATIHLETAQSRSGRFIVLRAHAKGGLGQVSVALDNELNRHVALKEMLSKCADDPASQQRFISEAEITGQLEHPGIVPIYGLGTYGDGRPYYAMRFVEGDNLKKAIDNFHKGRKPNEQLTGTRAVEFRNLLGRFVDVCNAIEYAHSRKVLHRDLKPENILLGPYGETLVVDWGLAKALKVEAFETTSFPANRPLQLRSGTDCETHYGSAVGTPAYMSPEQAEGKINELGPATDTYSLGATLYALLTGVPPIKGDTVVDTLQKVRRNEIEPLQSHWSAIPKPLQAICLRAMSQRQQDRYSSAKALSDEIEKWLADEPVSAFPEPLSVRVKRWLKRHPAIVSATVATLMLSLCASTFVAFREGVYRQAEAKHRREVEGKNQTIEKKNEELEKTLQIVSERTKLALDAFNQMVFGIQDKLKNRSGTLELRKDLLENARTGLKKILDEARKQGTPDSTLIWAYLKIGDVETSLGNTEEAKKEYSSGFQIAKQLSDADPSDEEARRNLGDCCERLGKVTLQLGNALEARAFFTESLEIRQTLAESDSKNGQAQRDLSSSYDRLGEVAMQLGNAPEAIGFYEKSHRISQALADADHNDNRSQHNLGTSCQRLGDVMLKFGKAPEAFVHYGKSLKIRQSLASTEPTNVVAQRDLSIGYVKLGDVTLRLGNAPEAFVCYEKSQNILQALADADEKNVEAQRDLSISYGRLGDVTLRLGNTPQALSHYEKALEIDQKLAEADPKNAQAQRDLGISYDSLGDITSQSGNAPAALVHYQKSLDVRHALADLDPGNAVVKRDLSISYSNLGNVTLKLGKTREALGFYEESLKVLQTLFKADPKNTQTRRDLSIRYSTLGDVTLQLGSALEALAYHQKSLEIRQTLADADPRNTQARRDLNFSYNKVGDVTLRLGKALEALTFYDKALNIATTLAEADPKNFQAQTDLFISFFKIGRVQRTLYEYEKAAESFANARAVLLPWHDKNLLVGQYKGAIVDMEQQVSVCRNAEKSIANINFIFQQGSDQIPELAAIRVVALLHRNNSLEAILTANRFAGWAEEQEKATDDQRYNAACLFALCAAANAAQRDVLLTQSLDLLEKIKSKNYFTPQRIAQMNQDSNFDGIRQESRFASFRSSLESNHPIPTRASPPSP